jgi:hypothetical protein
MKIAFQLLAIVSAGAGVLINTRLRPPFGFLIWILKILTGLPPFSPAMQASIYAFERFLALL